MRSALRFIIAVLFAPLGAHAWKHHGSLSTGHYW